jgi:hypothetical protein
MRSRLVIWVIVCLALILAVYEILQMRSTSWRDPAQITGRLSGSVGSQGASPEVSARPASAGDAKSKFLNERGDDKTRFEALSELGNSGDLAAKHFSLQIANSCNQWVKMQPAPLEKKNSSDQNAALQKLKKACTGVSESPFFQEKMAILKNNPTDVFDQDIAPVIESMFADKGPDGVLKAAVSAIKARPDETTVSVVSDSLSNLEISNIYSEQYLASSSSVSLSRRRQSMEIALTLLSCDFGRDCGPQSTAVLELCAGLGVCLPGADLQRVYEGEMLSGEDMRDVRALLDMLRRIDPWDYWTTTG